MNEYGYEAAPGSPGADRTPRAAKGLTDGIVLAAWVTGGVVLWWCDLNLPLALAYLANAVVIHGGAYAMARWKRTRAAWVLFWLLLAIGVVKMIAQAVTGTLGGKAAGPGVTLGLCILVAFYWLTRIPRRRPQVPPQEMHIYHHHILPGQEPGWAAGEVTGGTAAPLPAPGPEGHPRAGRAGDRPGAQGPAGPRQGRHRRRTDKEAAVTPRAIARAVIAAGWLAGITLILAGLPLWAALAVLGAVTAAAVAWLRWGAGLRTAVKLRHLPGRAAKTGGTLERA